MARFKMLKPKTTNMARAKYTDKTVAIEQSWRTNKSHRGYNYSWRKARLSFLAENPLCLFCLNNNQVTPATVVDHIKPHRGDMALFWDERNWQPLCKRCHDSTKKRIENAQLRQEKKANQI